MFILKPATRGRLSHSLTDIPGLAVEPSEKLRQRRESRGGLQRTPAGGTVIRSCNEMQDGRLEAGGVLKTTGSGGRALGTG